MDKNRALQLLEIERECVLRGYECDRKCEKCELVQQSDELVEMYSWVIKEIKNGIQYGTFNGYFDKRNGEGK